MKERIVNKDFIEKVKQANNIISVAGRYMHLKQKGKTHWACCPFHHEKTPSFAINEMQQYYHCFGCGVSGDVLTLVQQVENVDFGGALELLAKSAGLEMPAMAYDENYAKAAKKKQRVLEALSSVCEFYCENLYKDQNKSYLDYLYKRGITDELIKAFHLGASSDWQEALAHLKKKGFSDEELLDAGVAAKSESGRIYDAMALRLTFAIFNIYGDCIGFTGRTMQTADANAEITVAKYKNTAQTIVFDKGSIVYGVDVLKKNKLANFIDKLIVVEGNVDVISLVGAGFVNTVACMGTALTQFHAKIFKRFTDQVYICFDGDSAGQKATLRGLDILANENLSVRVVSIPDNLDPDDYIKKFGKEGFDKLIDEARPLIDFKLDYLEKTASLKDSLGKTEYLKAAAEILKPLAGTPQLELYVPRVAKTSGISFDAVLNSVTGSDRTTVPATLKDKVQDIDSTTFVPNDNLVSASVKAIRFIVASIAHNMDYAKETSTADLGIRNNTFRRLLDIIHEYKSGGKEWKLSYIFDHFGEEELAELDPIINFSFEIEQQALDKYYSDCVNYLLRQSIILQVDELKQKYKETDKDADKIEITMQIQALNKRIKNGSR